MVRAGFWARSPSTSGDVTKRIPWGKAFSLSIGKQCKTISVHFAQQGMAAGGRSEELTKLQLTHPGVSRTGTVKPGTRL
jgi:hypothetical protein